MTILFLDQFGELGGAQQCLLELIPAIRARGWSFHAAAPHGPLLERLSAEGALTAEPLPCGDYRRGRKSPGDFLRFAYDLPRLKRAIAKYEADLVYVNGPRILPAAALAARGRSPLLFHCHNYLGKRYAARLARRSLGWADAMVVAACRFVTQPLRPRRVRVVYNGVAGDAAPRPASPASGPWRIGVVGRIAPQKGQAVFLEAARRLPGCRFVICGAPLFGEQEHFERLRKMAAGLPVEFLGWRDDVRPVLRQLDMLVVPSIAIEAAPRVILEAYAAGVPVVAFRSGGIPEIVEDGVTGFLVEPFTAEALALRCGALLSDPERLRRAAGAARAAWAEKYTLERYRREMATVIEDAASRSRMRNRAARPAIPASTGR